MLHNKHNDQHPLPAEYRDKSTDRNPQQCLVYALQFVDAPKTLLGKKQTKNTDVLVAVSEQIGAPI